MAAVAAVASADVGSVLKRRPHTRCLLNLSTGGDDGCRLLDFEMLTRTRRVAAEVLGKSGSNLKKSSVLITLEVS